MSPSLRRNSSVGSCSTFSARRTWAETHDMHRAVVQAVPAFTLSVQRPCLLGARCFAVIAVAAHRWVRQARPEAATRPAP